MHTSHFRRASLLALAGLAVFLALPGCGKDHASKPKPPVENPLLDPSDPRVNQQAPDSFRVKVTTNRGEFVIACHRDWAPRGVDRFYNLVTNGFYGECRFFRVIFGFVAQFGINGDPAISAAWRRAFIQDDPPLDPPRHNYRGYVSFAMPSNVPDSRTTQIFINYVDNSTIDTNGYIPFGWVDPDGMYVVASLFKEYGDGPPQGPGPDQSRIQTEGNAYLATYFPQLDYVIRAEVLP